MAEINIQKKKTPIWPWIILILVIVIAVVVFLMNRENRNDDYDPVDRDTIGYSDQYNADTISASPFSDFVKDSSGMMDQNNDRYIKRSFALLADEMREVLQHDSLNGQPARQKIDSLINQARSINAEQMELKGEQVRFAARTAADILVNAGHNRYENFNSERSEIREAADNIAANKAIKDQHKELKEFFEKAANLLEKMRNETVEV